MAKYSKNVTAKAICRHFNIEIKANVTAQSLDSAESLKLKKAIEFRLAQAISRLPFADIYQTEVTFK